MSSNKKLVWDLPLRIFHWLFGLSILGLWITAERHDEQIHIWLGYFVIGLLIFRLCWGIWGSRHSQFRHFVPTPKSVTTYLKGFFSGDSKESVGHNPIGSIMVFLMFGFIGFQAFTGLFTFGDIWAGPYASALDTETVERLESFHHSNFNYILVLMALHIVAVFFYLFKKKQNLIWPMISGYKKKELVPEDQAIPHSKLWIALVTLICVAGFCYWLLFVNPPPVIYDDYYY